jgi:hypothetical protein
MSVTGSEPAADTQDQASGLRLWAEQNRADQAAAKARLTHESERTLMLFGLQQGQQHAHQTLMRWHQQGHRWVGQPERWRVVTVDDNSQDLPALARQQPRWGLWIDSAPDGVRQALQDLRQLHERGGPLNLLVLHTGHCRPDLLIHLRDVAWRYLGIRLLLIDERPQDR